MYIIDRVGNDTKKNLQRKFFYRKIKLRTDTVRINISYFTVNEQNLTLNFLFCNINTD